MTSPSLVTMTVNTYLSETFSDYLNHLSLCQQICWTGALYHCVSSDRPSPVGAGIPQVVARIQGGNPPLFRFFYWHRGMMSS